MASHLAQRPRAASSSSDTSSKSTTSTSSSTIPPSIRSLINTNSKSNPLAFPKAQQLFDPKLFATPSNEYRGSPLWAWNCKLDSTQIVKQISYLQEMGFGGFHMHPRTGLDTPYLSAEYFDIVKACVGEAEKKGMMACLYDEDRWPSGTAGGSVVAGEKGKEFRGRHLLWTRDKYGRGVGGGSPSTGEGVRSENGVLLGQWAVKLNANGCLEGWRRMDGVQGEQQGKRADKVVTGWSSEDERDENKEEPGKETGRNAQNRTQESEAESEQGEVIWYAYVETNPPSPWFNGQTYIDTLNPKAMRGFIESTHAKYQEAVGSRFGTTVPCIFTDEPQFARKTRLADPFEQKDIFLPWTDDLPETFAAAYGKGADLVAHLPELVWDLPDEKVSVTRYRFHDHVCERFVTAFMDQLGGWCEENGILLNGHMMEEPTLASQTGCLGETMRCYRSMGLPGMDLLHDGVEYTTAKQVASVARQRGIKGVMSEIYGCTHWYFTFEGHKGSGDWQAALGITFRVPHLSWASMAGEAKRDYPASINYQSPWYKEYGYVEDHFARVTVAMTRGRPVTKVAVVHPVESFWCMFGPDGKGQGSNGEKLRQRDHRFAELTDWLLHGLVDFDFISESMLPGLHRGATQTFDPASGSNTVELVVGQCRYEAVIVPDLRTIRSSTLRILNEFAEMGGTVLILGNAPQLVDAQAPLGNSLNYFCTHSKLVPWQQEMLLQHLDGFRDIEVSDRGNNGSLSTTLLYQLREDGKERFLFICNTNRKNAVDTTIKINGSWDLELLDTLSGGQSYLETNPDGSLDHTFQGCASLLLRLVPRTESSQPALQETKLVLRPPDKVSLKLADVTLSEPNVLMLDYARYEVNRGGALLHRSSGPQEILAINNEILDHLHLPRKGMAWRQPWTLPESDREPKADVSLEFQFLSATDVTEETRLAIELPDEVFISLNDTDFINPKPDGWWVDEAISTIPIPPGVMHKGLNTLILVFPFGVLTNIERVYILGNFKVQLGKSDGSRADVKILPWDIKHDPLAWGNIVTQHLPFYVGNITYKCNFTLPTQSNVTLSVPHFESPLLAVEYGNGQRGRIAFQPRKLDLGILEEGKHELNVTCFGNRYNAFGHIHALDWMTNCWPDAWRSQGWAWTDGYRVKPIGVMECPAILTQQTEQMEEGRNFEDDWVMVIPAWEAVA
jgi:hypothetical protein